MFSGAGITDLQKSNIMHAARNLMKKMPPLESGDRVLTKGDQCIALYFVGEGEVERVTLGHGARRGRGGSKRVARGAAPERAVIALTEAKGDGEVSEAGVRSRES